MASSAASRLHRRFTDAATHVNSIDFLECIQNYEKRPLLPLDNAIEPLILHRIIDDQILLEKTIEAKRRCRNPADGLTQDESAAICLYTEGEGIICGALNETLRDTNRRKLVPWYDYLLLFLTALYKLPFAKCETVWRGVVYDFSELYYEGKKVVFWGVTSCSPKLEVVNAFIDGSSGPRALFAIHSSMGKDISRHSWIPGEKEIVLVPGTYLKVSSIAHQTSGQLVIHMKDTRPPQHLLSRPFRHAIMAPPPCHSLRQAMREQEYRTNAKFHIMQLKSNYLNYLATEIERAKGSSSYRWRVLELSDCRIVPEGCIHIARILRELSLNELILPRNDLGTRGVDLLTKHFRNISGASQNSLTKLDLFMNKIDKEAVNPISRLRHIFPNLRVLNLSCNPLGFEPVVELLHNNRTLQELEVWDIQLSSNGAHHLAKVLRNTVLQVVNLGHNPIGYEGCQAIISALPHTLKSLDLNKINISRNEAIKILRTIHKPQQLEKVMFDGSNLIHSDH